MRKAEKVGSHILCLRVKAQQVVFTIDGEYIDFRPANQVAILRWLVKEVKLLQSKVEYLYCFPFGGDTSKEKRVKIFLSLGFMYNPEKDIYEWFK